MNQTQIDHLELDSTEVNPVTAKFLSLAFAFVLFAVPLSQAVVELRRSQRPQALDVFQPFVTGLRNAATGTPKDLWAAWRAGVAPEALHSYEAALENASIFKSFFQPRIQQLLTGVLGAGNEKVVLGRDGWIFYLPGLDYVVGPNVIAQATLDRAAKNMVDKGLDASPQPDPRPALLQFDRACRNAGIRLVVVPVPDKVMMQPAQLYERVQGPEAVPVGNNVGYARLVEEMRAQGVDWFDPAPRFVRSTDVRYLAQDTHWTPEFMDTVARDLADHIRQPGGLTAVTPVPMRVVEEQVSRVGDLVDMLKLTKRQSIFKPQTITIQRVVDERSGRSLEPDPTSDVLLVGDSFTNIYSQPEMGWGAAAGFGDHLAYHLRRPIDVIALNGGGATQVRAELARQENAGRLGYKKVIIYEFAIRNLLGENWDEIAMVAPEPPPVVTRVEATPVPARPAPAKVPSKEAIRGRAPVDRLAAKPSEPSPAAGASGLVVVGRIVQTSRVPAPGTAPYKDCLTFIKVRVESVDSGVYEGAEMLVVFLAMKDNQWLPAARYAVGDRLRLTVIPFSMADAEIRGMQRADDTEDYTLRPFYVLRENRE